VNDVQPQLPLWVDRWQQTLSWKPSHTQQQQFQQLYDHILAGNRQLNLTRITDPEEFWEKHLWDSLRGISHLLQHLEHLPQATAIDIGTGAGFPGIPIAIARPDWTVTLLDSTQKKVAFLETLPSQLNLTTIVPLAARSEVLGQRSQYREAYDIALVRAVAAASVCAEYALPLLKINGLAILYRGQWTDAETQSLQTALDDLGGRIEAIEATKTPISQSDRHLLYLRKVALTPSEFPRPVGIPSQHPLGM
jgi:16S rRNA (guanine527-N7)-methyltransferase